MKKLHYIWVLGSFISLTAHAQKGERAEVRAEARQRDVRTVNPARTAEPRVMQQPQSRPQVERREAVKANNDNRVFNREPRVVNEGDKAVLTKRDNPTLQHEKVDRVERTDNNIDRRNNNGLEQRRADNNRTDQRRVDNNGANNRTIINNNRVVVNNDYGRRNPSRPSITVINNRYVYNRIDRNYYPDYRRPYSFVGTRYTTFYRSHYYVPFGGVGYYYSAGFFYAPFDNYYTVVLPPVGIRIYALPFGFRRWYIGPSLYYYYGGVYYSRMNDSYQVVDAPLGSILPELPKDAKAVVIDGHKYFESNGTYYQETPKDNETWYTIVGKNGKLITNITPPQEVKDDNTIGDILNELPSDYKTVIVNNQKYYQSTDGNTYYQEIIVDNNLYYKVVAKPAQ